MKHLMFILFMLPAMAFAQAKADYEHAIGNFMKFYNNNQPDSIINTYSDSWGDMKQKLWSADKNDALMKEYGKMISYKYLGIDKSDHVTVFKVVFEKSTHTMSLTLNKENKVGTFRFNTTSNEIERMLKEAK